MMVYKMGFVLEPSSEIEWDMRWWESLTGLKSVRRSAGHLVDNLVLPVLEYAMEWQ